MLGQSRVASSVRLASIAVIVLGTRVADAGVLFTGTSGSKAASALFTQSGNNLLLTVQNTATADATIQTDILTAVFWDLVDAGSSTILSLVLQEVTSTGIYQQNSTVNSNANGTLDPLVVANLAAPGSTNGGPGSFDGGWQYREQAADFTGLSQNHGLGTNGLGVFNGNDVKDVDNEDYALTSAGDNVATSQAKQLFNFPLIKSSISFKLSGLPNGFVLSPSTVSNVRFQYGTSFDEGDITVRTGTDDSPPPSGHVPEPGSLLVFAGLGLLMSAPRCRSRRKAEMAA